MPENKPSGIAYKDPNFDSVSIGGVEITATPAEINQLDGTSFTATQQQQVMDAFGTVDFDRAVKVARVALAAVDTGGGVFSWVNPEAGAILVKQVLLDVTTQSSGACTVDVGMTAVSGTTSADNLIDGLSVATAGLYDNIENQGTNGTSRQKVAVGKWVTGSVASGASAGLVGYAYIHYINV